MLKRIRVALMWKGLVAASCATMLASGCSDLNLRLIAVGLQAAATALGQQQQDDRVTFGDWLASELNN